jgi:hypothetical protein
VMSILRTRSFPSQQFAFVVRIGNLVSRSVAPTGPSA